MGLLASPFRNDLCSGLKDTYQLFGNVDIAAEDPLLGLAHNLLDSRPDGVQLLAQCFEGGSLCPAFAALHALANLAGKSLGLAHDPADGSQQLPVALLQAVRFGPPWCAPSGRFPECATSHSDSDRAVWPPATQRFRQLASWRTTVVSRRTLNAPWFMPAHFEHAPRVFSLRHSFAPWPPRTKRCGASAADLRAETACEESRGFEARSPSPFPRCKHWSGSLSLPAGPEQLR